MCKNREQNHSKTNQYDFIWLWFNQELNLEFNQELREWIWFISNINAQILYETKKIRVYRLAAINKLLFRKLSLKHFSLEENGRILKIWA